MQFQSGVLNINFLHKVHSLALFRLPLGHIHPLPKIHMHMLLLLVEEKHAVPRIMRYWKSMITREIGKSIWQRSYYDHIIRDQREYDLIWEYIETNPLRWALDRYYFESESL